MNTHTNNLNEVPAAACILCGGWTSQGGCSQHSSSLVPVNGRTGCSGPHMNTSPQAVAKQHATWLAGPRLTATLKLPTPVLLAQCAEIIREKLGNIEDQGGQATLDDTTSLAAVATLLEAL